jgi:two-component system, NarL family, nitrate/nitrite response regulator NarL
MQRITENESMTTVLIGESSALNCELMATALERNCRRLSVVASAVTSAEILAAYAEKRPDVCVISTDLKAGPSTGLGATRELRAAHQSARVILLLGSAESANVVEAFRSGALGVFSREESFETLCKCIRKVHQGQIWASNLQLRYLVESLAAIAPPPITDAQGVSLLTKREQSLVQLVAEGRTNRDISRELGLSEHTVRNYLFRIFNKLGTSNRLELALYVINQRGSRSHVA